MQILVRVNNDVSKKEAWGWDGVMKQMPEVKMTLRRSVVFRPQMEEIANNKIKSKNQTV